MYDMIRIRPGGKASRGDYVRLSKLAGIDRAETAWRHSMRNQGYFPTVDLHPVNLIKNSLANGTR